jgi:alpha-galactosidase/6-phospho-beta-glucosidase family protein
VKIVYFGGGSLLTIASARHLLAMPAMAGGEIVLYDINLDRAEDIAAILRQAPEARAAGATVTPTIDLDAALDGADLVRMVACTWNHDRFARAYDAAIEHGLIGSDNLSLVAACTALRTGPILIDLLQRMERLCPAARLLIFTNPIALLTYLARQVSSIETYGICAGVSNYKYDIAALMGWDELRNDFTLQVAGINHFSWIKRLELDGQDFYPTLRTKLEAGIAEQLERLKGRAIYDNLHFALTNMRYALLTFGELLFSSELDGLPHLCCYDEYVAFQKAQQLKRAEHFQQARVDQQAHFHNLARRDLDEAFWSADDGPGWKSKPRNSLVDVRLAGAFFGQDEDRVTVSLPNDGAIEALPSQAIVEVTLDVSQNAVSLMPGYPCRLAPGIEGVTQSLLEWQQLTVEAIVEESPLRFRQSLHAYPAGRSRVRIDALLSDFKSIFADHLPPWVHQI